MGFRDVDEEILFYIEGELEWEDDFRFLVELGRCRYRLLRCKKL